MICFFSTSRSGFSSVASGFAASGVTVLRPDVYFPTYDPVCVLGLLLLCFSGLGCFFLSAFLIEESFDLW